MNLKTKTSILVSIINHTKLSIDIYIYIQTETEGKENSVKVCIDKEQEERQYSWAPNICSVYNRI